MIRPKPIFGWTLLDDLAPTPSSWLPQTESRFLGPRGWGTPLSCPFLQPGSCRFRWGQTPALARSVPGRLALSFQPRGQGPQRWWWHCPLSDAGHHPQVPSGWGPVGGELPVQPWLPIGYGAPQCPPPASPSLAGAATSVVMANAARSSGHSCASLRPVVSPGRGGGGGQGAPLWAGCPKVRGSSGSSVLRPPEGGCDGATQTIPPLSLVAKS